MDIIARKSALWKLGFRCFTAAEGIDPNLPQPALDAALRTAFANDNRPDEWRYAVYEFQLYTLYSPRLGRINAGVLEANPAPVRNHLDTLISQHPKAARATGVWEPEQFWDQCLALWQGSCCPVLIERLRGVGPNPSEATDLEAQPVARANVWSLSLDDVRVEGGDRNYFSVRDVSGWFPIGASDPAYTDDPAAQPNRYEAPEGVELPSWLARRRIFMHVLKMKGGLFGPVVLPWRAMEFRPKLLPAADRERILADLRWARMFRIVRAVSEQESTGYLDCLQGYDNANLSMPLFHYAAPPPPAGSNSTTTQLGGLAVWLDRVGQGLPARQRFASLGLSAGSAGSWKDKRGISMDYDTGSGERLTGAQGIIAPLDLPIEALPANEALALLKRPHMVYRYTMHLRALSVSRQSLWPFALQYLRQIAWLRIPDREDIPGDWRNRPLGQIVQSERNLALILRIAVKSPAWVITRTSGQAGVYLASTAKTGKQDATGAPISGPALLLWMLKAKALAEGSDKAFETTLTKLLIGVLPVSGTSVTAPSLAEVDKQTLDSVAGWPANWTRPYHLGANELHPDARSADGGIALLSQTPGSSPFLVADGAGWRFDDQHFAWTQAEDGHPPPAGAPFFAGDQMFGAEVRAMGIAPLAPPAEWSPAALRAATIAQAARELGAMGWSPKVVSASGEVTENPLRHALRVPGDHELRWTRLQWYARRAPHVVGIVCGPDTARRPAAADAVWGLGELPGKTIHAFDWREGKSAAQPIGAMNGAPWQAESKGDLLDASARASYGLPDQVLVTSTLALLRDAVTFSEGGLPSLDGFRVAPSGAQVTLRLGFLRAALAPKSGAAKVAPASEVGFFLELLHWRSRADANDPAQRFLRSAGFAFLPRPQAERFFSFKNPADLQPWSMKLGMGLVMPGGERAACNAPQAALALLTWPALHRWRTLLRESEVARRAMWDVWRIALREMLSLPALPAVFGKGAQLFDLFQSESALKLIACWAWENPASLHKTLGLPALRKKAAAWTSAGGSKDYTSWSPEQEAALLWDVLLPSLPDAALRKRLLALKPGAPPATRPYQDDLAALLYLDGLEGTEWSHKSPPAPHTGFIIAPDAGTRFGLALLTAPAPAAALSEEAALDGSSYLVTGIAPYADPGDGSAKAAAIELDTPIEVTLKGRGATGELALFGPSASDAQAATLELADLQSGFALEADVSNWLGGLGADTRLELLLESSYTDQAWELKAGLRLSAPWLRQPIEYPLRRLASIQDIEFDLANRRLAWNWDLAAAAGLSSALPLRATGRGQLRVGLDEEANPAVRLDASLDHVELQLGSPISALRLAPQDGTAALKMEADLGADGAGLVLTAPPALKASLRLELASLASGGTRVLPLSLPGRPDSTLAPISIDLGTITVPAGARELSLHAGAPRVPAWLFAGSAPWKREHGREFALPDVASDWFGGSDAGLFASLSDLPIKPALDDQALSLTLPLDFAFRGADKAEIMSAKASLVASCAVQDGYLVLSPSAFACSVSQVALRFTTPQAARSLHLGAAATLELPAVLEATLDLGGGDAAVRFTSLATQPVSLRFPADGAFMFDLEKLELGSGGASLEAAVRSGAAEVPGLPTLSGSVNIRKADKTAGRLVIERGRLVSATLSADARLRFFDDGDGVLTLALFQRKRPDGKLALGAMATFELALGRVFNVRALYLQVAVESVQLSLTWFDGGWSAKGGMTGSLAFVPAGPMGGRLSEYQELFDGTSVHFENLDLAKLGEASLTIKVTPRTFTLASLFEVTLQGITINKIGSLSLKSIGLLGEIAFKAKLPGLRTELTLGDIRLWQPGLSSIVPRIQVSSLGMSIALPSGFRFNGRLTEFSEDWEYGFGGSVYLESEAFPGVTALVKLTRLKTEDDADWVPSVVVYADQDRTDNLAYGFFLRKLGLGAAVDQGLVGFSDAEARKLPLPGRIQRALEQGIPYPGNVSSWVGVRPARPGVHSYSLVGYAQVSFGLLPRDTEHPFVTSLVLSIDDRLDIVAGLNGWFICSPDEALTEAFARRPAVRGSIGFSPRDQLLYGRFMTMQNPIFGANAEKNAATKLIGDALKACRLSVSLYCSPQGALLEIGYPRQARYNVELGPARGQAEAGFRIGYYRGTQVIGLNLAVNAEIGTGFSADLGFANVELSARAAFALQGSFAGAVTNSGQIYVLSELVISALFEISARVYKRIRIRTFFGSFTLTLFDLSTSVRITATAAVRAALVPSGLGFEGTAEVVLDIFGFHFGARLAISYERHRVGQARHQIDTLVPPIDELLKPPGGAPALLAVGAEAPMPAPTAAPASRVPRPRPDKWCYHVRVVGGNTRVLLYPDPARGAQGYPALPLDADGMPVEAPARHRLVLRQQAADRFRGLVGRAQALTGKELALLELSAAEMQSGTIKYLLAAMEVHAQTVVEEIVDPRTHAPVAGDFDDPAVLADPQRRSTRFRKRLAPPGDPHPTYDDYLLRAQASATALPDNSEVVTNAELLASLLRLAEDPEVRAGQDLASHSPREDVLDPLQLAAALGLVLEFTGADLADQIASGGIGAIAEQIEMFDLPVAPADWQDPAGRDSRFDFETDRSYWYQGQGEIGLTWQLTRQVRGLSFRSGPASHVGIRHFEVVREVLAGQASAAKFTVTPSWVVLREGRTARFIRPQFQFVDSGLPTDRELTLRYIVTAVGQDQGPAGANALCEEVYELVQYQPVRAQPAIAHAQATLYSPPGGPASVTLLVAIAFTEVGTASDEALRALVAGRIRLYTRPVPAGRIGAYGAGIDNDISLTWQAELSASELRLPQPVQSRRMAGNSMADGRPVALAADDWVLYASGDTEDGQRTLVLRATRPFASADEAATWNLLGVEPGGAAELHVQLGKQAGVDGVLPATPFQRLRLSLSTAPVPGAEQKALPTALESLFIEGREVAALERFTINRGAQQLSWLELDAWSLRLHIADGADTRDSLGWSGEGMPPIRLAGMLQHHLEPGGAGLAPPVAYRVWVRDAISDLDEDEAAARPMRVLRSFAVQPDRVFQALPERIVPRRLPGAAPSSLAHSDWRYLRTDRTLTVPPRNPSAFRLGAPAPAHEAYRKLACNGGAEALVQAALADALGGGPRFSVSLEELLAPPSGEEPIDRAAELLERAAEEVDYYGWRLLEGLGAAATIWLERDDDRIAPDAWAPFGPGVALVRFQRVGPMQRIEQPALYQYGARIFALDTLALLANLGHAGTDIGAWLAGAVDQRPWPALLHALDWLRPRTSEEGKIPASWIALLSAAVTRCARFVALGIPQDVQVGDMVQVAATPAPGSDGAGTAPDALAVLPALEGMVEFVHQLEEDYARRLMVAVEVVRRYDFDDPHHTVDTRDAALRPYLREIDLPRTLALEADRAAMAIDPRDGSIRALVQVHPAQRAHLYRPALRERVDFEYQCVQLQRRPAMREGGFERVLRELAFDWDAYRASWISTTMPQASLDWSARVALAPDDKREVLRELHQLRYPLLPPGYAWSVAVTTQAGVRVSGDSATPAEAVAPVEPLFADPGHEGVLAYRGLAFGWHLDGQDLVAELPFARAIDALPPPARAYWSAVDEELPESATGAAPVPVLQAPDLNASYVLTAYEPVARTLVDLVRLRPLAGDDGAVLAELLVRPYQAAVAAAYVQFGADHPLTALRGALGMSCRLALGAPELAWLAASLASETGWVLRCTVERDGIRFPMKEIA